MNQSLEIQLRIFTDDLELAIKGDNQFAINLGDEQEWSDAEYEIENYLREKFKIKFNDTELPMQFLGKEVELDLTYCYLEVPNIPNPSVIEIENSILFEHYTDQENEIQVSFNGWQKRVHLNTQFPSEILTN